jgi:hypothetical protein
MRLWHHLLPRPQTATRIPNQPTWEQVVGQLPMQPVLQHQKQRKLEPGECGWEGTWKRPHSDFTNPTQGPTHMPAGLVLTSFQVALHLDHLGTGR